MGWYNEIKAPAALFVKNSDEPVPLKLVEYHAKVTDGIARITLSQTYKNDNVSFLETVYHFPLSSIGVFVDFEAVYEDKVVKGKIKEKEEAKKEFNELKGKGHTVAYGEINEETPDIMAIELGNLLPNASVKINLTFVQPLEVSQCKFWKLIIPSTLTPRYSPSISSGPAYPKPQKHVQPADGSGEGMRYSSKLLYPWEVTVEIEDSPLKAIACLSHPDAFVTVNQNENTEVKFIKKEFPNADFALIYAPNDKPGEPRVKLARCTVGSSSEPVYCGSISFIPDLNEEPLDDAMKAAMEGDEFEPDIMKVPGEFIFFIDRSGSMQGRRMEKAKEALYFFIKSFPEDCFFNIVSFGSGFSFWCSESQKYTNKSSQDAMKSVSQMSADMGGTKICEALKSLFKKNLITNYPRRIFLLTDGDVDNTGEVLKLISSNCDGIKTRLYTIGIGNGCSQHLVREGAKAGKGSYEFIGDNGDISGRIIKMLENALLPNITAVNVKFEEQIVSLAGPLPTPTESFPANSFFSCFLVFADAFKQKKFTEVEISFMNGMTRKTFSKKLRFSKSDCLRDNDSLHKLAVKRFIDDHTERKTEKYKSKSTDLQKLAVDFQVLTSQTAFVCLISENSIDKAALKEEKVIIASLISSDYKKAKKPIENEDDEEDFDLPGQQASLYSIMQFSTPIERGERLDSLNKMSQSLQKDSITFCKKAKKSSFFSSIASGIGSLFPGGPRKMMAPECSMEEECMAPEPKRKKRSFKSSECKNMSDLSPIQHLRTKNKQKEDFDNLDVDECHQKELPSTKMNLLNENIEEEKSPFSPRRETPSISSKESTSSKILVSKCDLKLIINQQQVNGKWEVSPSILGSLCVTEALLEKLLPNIADPHIRLTLFILAWLEKFHGASSSSWNLIKKKAESFLKSNGCKSYSKEIIQIKSQIC